MTIHDAERLCKMFQRECWPQGVDVVAYPTKDADTGSFVVTLSYNVNGHVETRRVTSLRAIRDMPMWCGLAKGFRKKVMGGQPPRRPSILVATTPEEEPTWQFEACQRVRRTGCPKSVADRVCSFVNGLEIDDIPAPIVDQTEGVVHLEWDDETKSIDVIIGDGIVITVDEEGQPIPWADDEHQWPKGRAVQSLRVWLRWMFPLEKEIYEISQSDT